jgi:DNA-binding NtrC family response regulator
MDLATDAMDALLGYRWPGNVRELKNVVERIVLKATGPTVKHSDLPSDVVRSAAIFQSPGVVETEPDISPADALATQMMEQGESFWSVVYPQFMSRDLTRAELRRIIQIGLENTNGNYRLLVQLFNMPAEDYKRFLSFLRKHDCHLPFQRFRVVPARLQPEAAEKGA